jgi:hypothetical protein
MTRCIPHLGYLFVLVMCWSAIKKGSGGPAFDGTMAVSGSTYGIGSAEWDDILEDTVVTKFHITSSR